MKTIFSALGAIAFAFCIYAANGSDVESQSPLNTVKLRLDSLEQLDFSTLIDTSQANPQERNLFEQVFRKMLKDHEFNIYNSKSTGEILINYDKTRVMEINNNENFEKFMKFLEDFGHCISKLYITSDKKVDGFWKILAPEISRLAKFVNDVKIDGTDFINNNVLTEPFAHAEIVTILGDEVNATALHKYFPAVRSLNLQFIELRERLPHFSQLEHLRVPRHWRHLPLDVLEQTLELNPQMKHLYIGYSGWNVIQRVSEILPELESLEFVYSIVNENHHAATAPIRFTNMTVFKFTEVSTVDAVDIEFGNLEEIEFGGQAFTDYWVDLTTKNKQLRIVSATIPLGRQHLERIANELPHLEEFTVKYDYEDTTSAQDIADFLQSANRLKRAAFLELAVLMCAEVDQQLSDEWETIEDSALYSCTFVRK